MIEIVCWGGYNLIDHSRTWMYEFFISDGSEDKVMYDGVSKPVYIIDRQSATEEEFFS